MKVIVTVDDSPFSQEVIKAIQSRQWEPNTEFRILTVLDSWRELNETLGDLVPAHEERREKLANKLCKKYREVLESSIPDAIVHFEVRRGVPKVQIIDAAVEWSADKIFIGSHGHRTCPHNLVGSVSRAVTAHAPCSVEVIKEKKTVSKKSVERVAAAASASVSEPTES
ncbi:MAG: universal stress protein [Candidatus Obscuribacterales bacterium]|nr:universal stress protein [Candidatus Obscuribacterales bacterium]